ncbi:MAG: glycosyl hydrolase 115 family protein [Sedimentisphaerales bacterium]|nr:glycosyl hydrolase 115 family protein [Sedimentisphaerales bacterium]
MQTSKKINLCLSVLIFFICNTLSAQSTGTMSLVQNGKAATIVVDNNDFTVCRIAASCLADDIEMVSNIRPEISNDITTVNGPAIIVGTIGKSSLIDELIAQGKINVTDITGKWETFIQTTVDQPYANISQALVIAGSDRRGTAFGIFDISEQIGVSPWAWWADVAVAHNDSPAISTGSTQQGPPSVKYRGIFINDEDWGLHPWARDNYSPEDQYIGPKVYARVFELLLRLKANYIWPAMHLCTKGFYTFPENKHVADDYAIVVGSSHCEQMLRNNEWEWRRYSKPDGNKPGDWDWCTNSDTIIEYWRQRVEYTAGFEGMYTLGMRGIHDSGMPCKGADNHQKMLAMQNEIFPAQRKMLNDYNKDMSMIGQIFCPYKEVLDLYRLGMKVPEDVILVWPDDNHGYIRYLCTPQEQKRSGGSGVYYHVSYWGEPEDYLWLCSTPPALILEEMLKAYDYNARSLWVLNVGDIKPAEIAIELFTNLGWDINSYSRNDGHKSLVDSFSKWFGSERAPEIAQIMTEYYQLGQARKPEHSTSYGIGFSLNDNGDEAAQRVGHFQQLDQRATAIYNNLPDNMRDSYYQLVLYPVRCAGLMSAKVLNAARSVLYAKQGRVVANDYAKMAKDAYEQIKTETEFYNKKIADGKWDGVMCWNPRDQRAYKMPQTATVDPEAGAAPGIILEGQETDLIDSGKSGTLPLFSQFAQNSYYFDLFNKGYYPFDYKVEPSDKWITIDKNNGQVSSQERIVVSVNYDLLPEGNSSGELLVKAGATISRITVNAYKPEAQLKEKLTGVAVVTNGSVTIEAENFSRKTSGNDGSWETIPHLGISGSSVTVLPTTAATISDVNALENNSPCMEYDFYCHEPGVQQVQINCLPTHPINAERGLRYAVAIDDGEKKVVAFDTKEYAPDWKVNVVNGQAVTKTEHKVSSVGKHTLKVWMVDPGVVLDKIIISQKQ